MDRLLCDPRSWRRWSACPGSVCLEAGEPEVPPAGAADAAQASNYAASVLLNGWENTTFAEEHEPLRERVQLFVARVRAQVDKFKATGAGEVLMLPQQRVMLEPVTGERGASTVCDAVIVAPYAQYSVLELDQFSLWGVDENDDHGQLDALRIVALVAVVKYRALHNFRSVLIRIHDRQDEPLSLDVPIEQLYEFGHLVTQAAALALELAEAGPVAVIAPSSHDAGYAYLRPDMPQCSGCRAAHRCPAIARAVHETVFGQFEPLYAPGAALVDEPPVARTAEAIGTDEFARLLPQFIGNLPMIERWCQAIREAM